MAVNASGGTRRFYFILGGVAAVGVGVLVFLSQGSRSVSIPANVTVQEADTSGFRGYVLGSDSAPVEITEYADFQCPACARFDNIQFPDVQQRLIETGRVRWRYRDFPLQQHQNARLAAHAAACADDQGKYWPMHRFLYEGQPDWEHVKNATDEFRGYAKSAGLDVGQYDACMESTKHAGRIQASSQEGLKVGVNSTPTFVIGGRLFPGILPYDEIRRLVDSIASVAAAPVKK